MGLQRLSGQGLEHCASPRIHKRRLGREAGAVSLPTQQRMANVSEMRPDLMGPAGFQPAGEKARDRLAVDTGVFLHDLPMGYGFAAALPDGLLVACLGMAVDRRIDRTFGATGNTPDERQ